MKIKSAILAATSGMACTAETDPAQEHNIAGVHRRWHRQRFVKDESHANTQNGKQ
jgi:hypothetical protein